MKQIHFHKETCGKIIWAACSISGLKNSDFWQFCTDDPNKTTCRTCQRTKIYKRSKAKLSTKQSDYDRHDIKWQGNEP